MDASGSGSAASERRIVTVLFADLVGSTDLAATLDAEDLREVVEACFTGWRRAVEAHGGEVEKLIGDALMAVFGLRASEDDDAHRAVRAAIALRDGMPDLLRDVPAARGLELGVRVGVDSGEVVATRGADRDFRVVGAVVNRASRLQGAAPVNGVMVSSTTRDLVRGAFAYRENQTLALKGFDDPVEAAVVISERPAELTLDAARGVEGVTTGMVGRAPQLRMLQDRFLDVVEESALRVVTVVGEAGIGKSRLLGEFDAWLAEHPVRFYWFRGRSAPGGRSHANALARSVVAHRLRLAEDDTSETIVTKLRQGFRGAWDGDEAEADRAADVVGAWLGYDLGSGVPADALALRTEATQALAGFFARLADRQPVVILIEDLHWADDGSLAFLDDAAELLAGSAVLIVATARPVFLEDRPRWGEGLTVHERVALGTLSRREARDLTGQLLRRIPDPPADLVEQLVEASEGNPFFLEELVTWLVDSGAVETSDETWRLRRPVTGLALPTSLRGVLQARLDAVPSPHREALQRASVVGRVFWDDAVAHLGLEGDPELPASLDDLRRRELVQEREFSSFERAREFVFAHALVRDVAYGSVLRSVRRRHHRRVADWLISTSAAVGRDDEYAAPIAEHLDHAEDDSAADWYLRASRRALSVFGLDEARRLARRAHELARDDAVRFDAVGILAELDDRTADPDALEHDLEDLDRLAAALDPGRRATVALLRCRALNNANRYPESVEAGRTAIRIADAAGEHAIAAEALLWVGKSLTWDGDAEGARGMLDRAIAVAGPAGRPLVVAEATRYLSMVANNLGEFPMALELVDAARAAFAAVGDAEGEGASLAQRAATLFNLDRVAEARADLLASLPVFRRSGHRQRAATVVSNLGVVAESLGELAEARRCAREAIPELRRAGDAETLAISLLTEGAVAAAVGDVASATEALTAAIEHSHPLSTGAIDGRRRLALLALDQGDLPLARSRIYAARAEAEGGSSELERTNVLMAEGWVLLAEGDPRAATAFDEAERRLDALGVAAHRLECRAGRAAAVSRTDPAGAVALVEDLLGAGMALDAEALLATLDPEAVILAILHVVEAADDPRGEAVRRSAESAVRRMAERIGDDGLARGYLASRPVRAVLETAGA